MFMGVAQIMLDDLDLSNVVSGWYKLYGTSSLVSLPAAAKQPGLGGSSSSGGGGPGSFSSGPASFESMYS